MIVKFKLFEKKNNKLEIGDYVIIDAYNSGYKDEGIKFLSTHIGEIANISSTNKICSVLFEETFKGERQMYFNTNKILYYSKNKEDVESYLASMKYNL